MSRGGGSAEEQTGAFGLILAAGEGTRFGPEPKLLATLNRRPLVEHAVRAQCEVAELERVVIVLGAHAQEVLDRADLLRAQPLICPDWQEGQAASLRHGMRFLVEQVGAARVVVTLGDEPLINAATVARFAGEPPGTRALWSGRPGHPVVLGPEHLPGIESLRGDRGARQLLRDATEIECADMGGAGLDIDTPKDLEAVRGEARAVL